METKSIIFYFSLMLIFGCAAEVFVRLKGYGAKTEKDRKGLVIPYKPKLIGPLLLGIAAIVMALLTG